MMDSVDPEVVEGLERAAGEVEQVEGIGSVRARWVGHRLHGEISVRVSRDLSVAEAARFKEKLYEAAKRGLPKLERLTVETKPS